MIDQSINRRLSHIRNKRKKPPVKKGRTLGRKVLDAAETVDNFILFNHLREGRIGIVLATLGARVLAGLALRPIKKLPKKKSVLTQRRKARKHKSIKFSSRPVSRRSFRRRVPQSKRTFI